MAEMPHLVQMDKKYAKKGLALIGVHRQTATDEELKKVIKDYKIEFPIVKSGGTPIESRGIPHMFVFNTEGAMIFSGDSEKAEDVIRKELRKAKPDADSSFDSSSSLLSGRPKELFELRAWKNSEGKEMKASLVSVKDGVGSFKFANGKAFEYPLSKLSQESQDEVTEKLKEETIGE